MTKQIKCESNIFIMETKGVTRTRSDYISDKQSQPSRPVSSPVVNNVVEIFPSR